MSYFDANGGMPYLARLQSHSSEEVYDLAARLIEQLYEINTFLWLLIKMLINDECDYVFKIVLIGTVIYLYRRWDQRWEVKSIDQVHLKCILQELQDDCGSNILITSIRLNSPRRKYKSKNIQ